MYKNGFGINNLQWMMYYETKPKQYISCRHVLLKVTDMYLVFGFLFSLPNEVYLKVV